MQSNQRQKINVKIDDEDEITCNVITLMQTKTAIESEAFEARDVKQSTKQLSSCMT